MIHVPLRSPFGHRSRSIGIQFFTQDSGLRSQASGLPSAVTAALRPTQSDTKRHDLSLLLSPQRPAPSAQRSLLNLTRYDTLKHDNSNNVTISEAPRCILPTTRISGLRTPLQASLPQSAGKNSRTTGEVRRDGKSRVIGLGLRGKL